MRNRAFFRADGTNKANGANKRGRADGADRTNGANGADKRDKADGADGAGEYTKRKG